MVADPDLCHTDFAPAGLNAAGHMLEVIVIEKDTLQVVDDHVDCPVGSKKRAVRQDWIEGIVLRHLIWLVRNMDLLEFIAENTYQYYLAQNTDTTYTKSLQKALDETERAIANLLRAIEAGIFNESTKDRMNELQEQKTELKTALATAKLKEEMGLKKEHILFFLHQFTNMDYTDIDCQRRLIKTFLNSVFVYDDKVVLTFNYSGDNRTMTLHEIDGGLGHSICIPSCVVHQIKKDIHLDVLFYFMICMGIERALRTHAGSMCLACGRFRSPSITNATDAFVPAAFPIVRIN